MTKKLDPILPFEHAVEFLEMYFADKPRGA
jgi:hypothetical protein